VRAEINMLEGRATRIRRSYVLRPPTLVTGQLFASLGAIQNQPVSAKQSMRLDQYQHAVAKLYASGAPPRAAMFHIQKAQAALRREVR